VLQFSVQRDHVHLIVEARDKRALSTGIQSVAIRVARYVNDLLGRHGALWADRWHGRALKTPREVRNALKYVLSNFRKHVASRACARPRSSSRLRGPATAPFPPGIDPYSSGEWFDGWREWTAASGTPPPFVGPPTWRPRGVGVGTDDCLDESTAKVVAMPRTWLAAVGWRRHGLIGLAEAPSPPRPSPAQPQNVR